MSYIRTLEGLGGALSYSGEVCAWVEAMPPLTVTACRVKQPRSFIAADHQEIQLQEKERSARKPYNASADLGRCCATPQMLPHGPVFRILKAMDINLTPDQKAFARRAIESGRLHSEEDAVQEALALWEERERQRAEFLLTLDDARASLARGGGRVITQESMRQLASEVKKRGRARLLAELTTSP